MMKSQINIITKERIFSINFEIELEMRFISLKQEIAVAMSLHRDFFSIFVENIPLQDFDIIHSSKVFMEKKKVYVKTNGYFEGFRHLKKVLNFVSVDLRFSRIVQIDMLEELMLFQMTKNGNDSFPLLKDAIKAYMIFGGDRHFPVKLANQLGFVGLGVRINLIKVSDKIIETEI